MLLDRISSNSLYDHRAESTDYNSHGTYKGAENDGEHVHNLFDRFGTGTDNFNTFRVSLDWKDVEDIIHVFLEMGHPAAARLERARKLAKALDDFAENSN